jgi:hypothetical protein
MDRNLAQRPTHNDVQPILWLRHSGARGPLVEPAHVCLHAPGTRRGMASSGATVAEWGTRASTVEGPPTGQVGEGGNSPELLADGKGRKNRDIGGVLQ